jgi:NDP-sugar pyrophosphorylase family protein
MDTFSYQRFFSELQNEVLLQFFRSYPLSEIIPNIEAFIIDHLPNLGVERSIHASARISPQATLQGPMYIGPEVVIQDFASVIGPAMLLAGAFVGHGAFVRESVILGAKVIVGHGSEVTHSVILDETRVTHMNVVSYSLVGSKVNLSSHVVLGSYLLHTDVACLPDRAFLRNAFQEKVFIPTTKFGAIIGDRCRLGGSVLVNPGVVMEPDCVVFPLVSLKSRYYRQHSCISLANYAQQVRIRQGDC